MAKVPAAIRPVAMRSSTIRFNSAASLTMCFASSRSSSTKTRTVSQRKRKPVDSGERRAKLVGQVGDEVVPRLGEDSLTHESFLEAARIFTTTGSPPVDDDQHQRKEEEDHEPDRVGNPPEALS